MNDFFGELLARWTGRAEAGQGAPDRAAKDGAAMALASGSYPALLHDGPFWESVDPVGETTLTGDVSLGSGDLTADAPQTPILVWSDGRRLSGRGNGMAELR